MQLSRHSFAFFFIYENIGFRHFLLNPRNVDLCNLRYLSTRPEPFEPSGNIWIAQDIWSLVRAIVLFCLLLGWFTQRRPVVACSMTLGRPAFSFSGRANKVVQVSPQQSETRAGEINSFGFYGFGQKTKKMVSSLLFPVIRRSASDVPWPICSHQLSYVGPTQEAGPFVVCQWTNKTLEPDSDLTWRFFP